MASACFVLATTGCSNVNLGDVDETRSERDEMPGPGLFSGEKGYLSVGGDESSGETGNTETAEQHTTDVASDQDLKEFEAYQRWKSEERHSEHYREFEEWQRFKKWKQMNQGQ